MDSVEYLELTRKSKMRQLQRIDQSVTIKLERMKILEGETYEYQDSVSIRFPVLNHLVVLFGRHFQIH